jgi:hypothetical protein
MLKRPDNEDRQTAEPTSGGTRAQDNGERSHTASKSYPSEPTPDLPGAGPTPSNAPSDAPTSPGAPPPSESSAPDRSESGGNQPGSARRPVDSGGYQPGSASHPVDSGGYRTGSEGEALLHEVVGRASTEAMSRRQRVRERTYALTEGALLDELYEELEKERPRAARRKQLGIRMQPRQWERLELVAAWSGVPVTTMARVLINRGAKAVIDEELRMRQRFGPEAE